MQAIERIFDWLERVSYKTQQRRIDAFLAEATSLPDLEDRMRRLDRGTR
jgi:hypothetical protein